MKTENLNHYGWICRKCGKVLAPWMPYCTCYTVDGDVKSGNVHGTDYKNIKCCEKCEFMDIDGHCYTSGPPRVKCTKTGDYHPYTHVCDLFYKERECDLNERIP